MPTSEPHRRAVSLKEPVLIALETLRAHKLRSFLTLLGVVLSVGTLIVVVSMVEGTNNYVADKIANFGSNVFLVQRFPLVTSQEQFVKLQRTNKMVTWDDYEYVRDNMTMAKAAGMEARRLGKVKYKSETIETFRSAASLPTWAISTWKRRNSAATSLMPTMNTAPMWP
jgi:ABC-type lipoprotein release transport system permease subunit